MKVQYARAAVKDAARLDEQTRARVRAAIERLPAGDVKKLQDRPGYRLRVGDWRVLFDRRQDGSIIVQRILHRSAAY